MTALDKAQNYTGMFFWIRRIKKTVNSYVFCNMKIKNYYIIIFSIYVGELQKTIKSKTSIKNSLTFKATESAYGNVLDVFLIMSQIVKPRYISYAFINYHRFAS